MARKPRADAVDNRQRIVEVARASFARDGLELPLRELARRAGLGAATLHRHFPTREDIVHAALAEQVAACRAELEEARSDPDPWRGLCSTVRLFTVHQLHDRGLNQALLGTHPAGAAFASERRTQARGLSELVARAGRAGALRPGVTVDEVRVALTALASYRPPRPAHAEAALGTLTELLLTGLGTQPPPGASSGTVRPAARYRAAGAHGTT